MSITCMLTVWKHVEGLTAHQTAVLLAIADHISDETRTGWTSVGLMVKRTRLSESSVQRCLRELEEGGYIETKPRPGYPSVYRVLFDEDGTPVDKSKTYPQTPVSLTPPPPPTPVSLTPHPSQPDTPTPVSLTPKSLNTPSKDKDARARAPERPTPTGPLGRQQPERCKALLDADALEKFPRTEAPPHLEHISGMLRTARAGATETAE